jgi:NADH-quinone oxidoreductase subunit J
MDVKSALFYAFAAVLLFAAVRVITVRNPVHAALYLILAFFQAAGVWMLLHAEFLSITLVLVYVGAVMVLFLFVVMMIDINLDALKKDYSIKSESSKMSVAFATKASSYFTKWWLQKNKSPYGN